MGNENVPCRLASSGAAPGEAREDSLDCAIPARIGYEVDLETRTAGWRFGRGFLTGRNNHWSPPSAVGHVVRISARDKRVDVNLSTLPPFLPVC